MVLRTPACQRDRTPTDRMLLSVQAKSLSRLPSCLSGTRVRTDGSLNFPNSTGTEVEARTTHLSRLLGEGASAAQKVAAPISASFHKHEPARVTGDLESTSSDKRQVPLDPVLGPMSVALVIASTKCPIAKCSHLASRFFVLPRRHRTS